jgi:hypothetical protein
VFLYNRRQGNDFRLNDTCSLKFGFGTLLLRENEIINEQFASFVVMQLAPLSRVPDKIYGLCKKCVNWSHKENLCAVTWLRFTTKSILIKSGNNYTAKCFQLNFSLVLIIKIQTVVYTELNRNFIILLKTEYLSKICAKLAISMLLFAQCARNQSIWHWSCLSVCMSPCFNSRNFGRISINIGMNVAAVDVTPNS